jgi:hypothetical protein
MAKEQKGAKKKQVKTEKPRLSNDDVRDSSGRFIKGRTGNPRAGLKGFVYGKSFKGMAQQIMESKSFEVTFSKTTENGNVKTKQLKVESNKNIAAVIACIVFDRALDGDMKAIEFLYDRMEGKPKQMVHHVTEDEKPIDMIRSKMTQKEASIAYENTLKTIDVKNESGGTK